MASSKVKILYSHGGRILPLSPNRLSYVGGQTKLLSLDRRSATLPLLLSRLSSLSPLPSPSFSLKYQLPGLDLDSLVSVVDHDDFHHMMYEHDSACASARATNKTPRLRLFLFPVASESPAVSVNPDYLFGLDDVSGAGNSAGSDAFPSDKIFEDLISGNYCDNMGANSKLPAEPVRVALPVQTAAGYYQTAMTQPVTGPMGNAYYALPAAPVGYYEGGRYQSVQLKAIAGDDGYQHHPPQVIGYDGAGAQRMYYVLPQQGYQVGIDVIGNGIKAASGRLGSEAKGIGLTPLPEASAV